MKHLYKLKKVEYKNGSDIAFANASSHFQVAVLCSKNDHIGIAVSHIVIACEELCKASILRLRFLAHDVHIPDLRKYFSDHKVKHERIIQLFLAICQFEDENKEEIIIENKNSDFRDIILNGLLLIAIIFAMLAERNNPDSLSFEEIRTRGFYVDLSDDKKWMMPNDIITKEQLAEYLKTAQNIFQIIEQRLFKQMPRQSDILSLIKELGYIKEEISKS